MAELNMARACLHDFLLFFFVFMCGNMLFTFFTGLPAQLIKTQ